MPLGVRAVRPAAYGHESHGEERRQHADRDRRRGDARVPERTSRSLRDERSSGWHGRESRAPASREQGRYGFAVPYVEARGQVSEHSATKENRRD